MTVRLGLGPALGTPLVAVLAVALLASCSGSGADEPELTATQLRSIVPSVGAVQSALGVAPVAGRENDGLSQAFEGLDLPEGLESYGYGYTNGNANAGDWSAVGLSLVLVSSAAEAKGLLGDLTAGGGWSDVEIDGTASARTQHFESDDGFTGDRVVARSGTLLIDLTTFGSADVPRAEAARDLTAGIVERAVAANE